MRILLKKPAVILTALYTLAWGPMLLLRGDYWDGWILVNQFVRPDLHYLYSIELAPQRLYHYYALARFAMLFPDPILVTRALIFASWLVAGLILYRIMRRYLGWSETSALLMVLYYLIFPTYFVRFELFLVCYSLANLLFILGCYLALEVSKFDIARMVREIFAGTLFLLSFLVNSIPIYFFGFLMVHIYIFTHQQTYNSLRSALTAWLRRYFYLVLLPIIFLSMKILYFKPYGVTVAYNEPIIFREGVTILTICYAMIHGFWSGMYIGIVWLFARALILMERKYFAVALLLATVAILLIFKWYKISQSDIDIDSKFRFGARYISKAVAILISGFLLCLLGLFPYIVVGKTPHIYGFGFGLRHTLLFPLGSALFFFGSVTVLFRKQVQNSVHIALFSLCLAFIWYNFFLLDLDWYKQRAIMHELPQIVARARVGTLFIFNDEVAGLNWNSRNISYQEYDGYLQLITGTRNYLGVNKIIFDNGAYLRNPAIPSAPITTLVPVTISSGRTDDPRLMDWVHLKYAELFKDDEQFNLAVHDRLQISLNVGTSTKVQK